MYRILSGISSIIAGIVAVLYGIIPHYYQLAVNNSIEAGAPKGPGPVNLPAMVAIPPINYFLIVVGAILMGIGVYLLLTGIRGSSSGPFHNRHTI